MWELLPAEIRETMTDNAATIVDLLRDPHWADLDVAALAGGGCPMLLTDGVQSPSWMPSIVRQLAHQLDGAARHTFAGSGHMPHQTEPDEYIHTVLDFLQDPVVAGPFGLQRSRFDPSAVLSTT